jgi:hypothetical protein
MADSLGFIHSVIAPIFRKVEHEERPGWDRSKKRQDARAQAPKNSSPAVAGEETQQDGEQGVSSTHIDLRI